MTQRQPIALVVDDQPLVRMDAADMISAAGFDVLEAADAEEALFHLKEHPSIRLLFTDVQMPEIDGLSLVWKVRANWPQVSIIVTSGAMVPEATELPEGVRFIAKPFTPKLIVDTIREVCDLPAEPELTSRG